MDFKLVTKKLLTAFEEQKIQYALIGGFALGLWGVNRTTGDIDFLVNSDDLIKIDRIMRNLGYECNYKTENVSQYVSPLEIFGEVDFLHAFREISLEMLKHAEEKEIFSGSMKIKVLKPEDIVGLKLQAINNNPLRKQQDLIDVESLVAANHDNLDWNKVEKYFDLFGMVEIYKEIDERYHQ
ncbi:MAG: nucleotidyl transferase AbiEii/AbiGii toxin family protein [Planctomycetota bacterium]